MTSLTKVTHSHFRDIQNGHANSVDMFLTQKEDHYITPLETWLQNTHQQDPTNIILLHFKQWS